jgi:hypothetical protein
LQPFAAPAANGSPYPKANRSMSITPGALLRTGTDYSSPAAARQRQSGVTLRKRHSQETATDS